MTRDPFAEIRHALAADPTDTIDDLTAGLRLDPQRADRTGIPEVVLAGHKQVGDLAISLQRLADAQGRSLASRLRPDQVEPLRTIIGGNYDLVIDESAHVAIVAQHGAVPAATGGRVVVISAGSSDRPVAREAAIMAGEMGCEVRQVEDVGVAGLHRLIRPIRDLVTWEPHAVIVAAGMDGALPSVVAGLLPYPVIGLPVSVGYGYGGDGTAALMGMLQSCSPGLAVVNIDNGIGAGSMAALIANRAIS